MITKIYTKDGLKPTKEFKQELKIGFNYDGKFSMCQIREKIQGYYSTNFEFQINGTGKDTRISIFDRSNDIQLDKYNGEIQDVRNNRKFKIVDAGKIWNR